MSDLFKWTKKDLRRLPSVVDFSKTTWYDGLFIFPSKIIHDSGWRCMTIVGIQKEVPTEIINQTCDDIQFPVIDTCWNLRMDLTPNGIFHIWSNKYFFSLNGYASSTDILVKDKREA